MQQLKDIHINNQKTCIHSKPFVLFLFVYSTIQTQIFDITQNISFRTIYNDALLWIILFTTLIKQYSLNNVYEIV